MESRPPQVFVPTRMFLATGVGYHETARVAMQRALEEAGIAEVNLVKISSVIAPGCRIITRKQGQKLLHPGGIVHAVIAQGQTTEPHQRVTPALCWAQPEDESLPGFITEVEEDEANGKTAKTATDIAGEAVVTIMAEKLRARLDAKALWAKRGRDRRVRIKRTTIRVGAITATAVGPEDGSSHAVALCVAVFL